MPFRRPRVDWHLFAIWSLVLHNSAVSITPKMGARPQQNTTAYNISIVSGCKESQFYSLPLGQVVASIY